MRSKTIICDKEIIKNNPEDRRQVLSAVRYIMAVLTIMLMLYGFSGPSEPAQAATGRITGIQFLKKTVDAMNGYNSTAGRKIRLGISSTGRVKVCGSVISAKKVKAIKKKYSVSLKNAAYIAAAQKLGLLDSTVLKGIKKDICYRDALAILGRAVEYIDGVTFSQEDIEYVISNRISNITGIRKNGNRKAAARGYMTGIYTGTSDGSYSGTRSIKIKSGLSSKTAAVFIKRLKNKDLRDRFSNDWQVLKKKKLPKNSRYYKYIVADIPNSYYDTGFNGWTDESFETDGIGKNSLADRVGTTIGPLFVYPSEIEEYNSLAYPEDFVRRGLQYQEENRNEEIPREMIKGVKEFYELALNVDYRTIEKDMEWQNAMGKFLKDYELENYIRHCVENRTIIECDRVAADLSSVYLYDGEYNCKVYAHMRIVSDLPLEKKIFTAEAETDYGYLYPVRTGWSTGSHYTRIYFSPMYLDYSMGEWTDYYFNATGARDLYGCLNCSNTSTGIMIDYSGCFPWLTDFPYRKD